MINEKTEWLLEKLAQDPKRFVDKGGGSALLQRLFQESDISFMAPLLRSEDPDVVKVAIFCASELGARAYPLMDDVLPLTQSTDTGTVYSALEVIAVCSVLERVRDYSVVLKNLVHAQRVIRVRVMELVVNGDPVQFEAADRSGTLSEEHSAGLALLALGPDLRREFTIQTMVTGSILTSRYCAVAAVRNSWNFEEALYGPMDNEKMDDLRPFLRLKSVQRRLR